MTIKEYKQQLYDMCREHNKLAQKALDRCVSATAKNDQAWERARLDNMRHLAACTALQWALDKARSIEQEAEQTKHKILLVEDGSVDVDELQKFFNEQGMKIKIIIYRQGAPKPELKEL